MIADAEELASALQTVTDNLPLMVNELIRMPAIFSIDRQVPRLLHGPFNLDAFTVENGLK